MTTAEQFTGPDDYFSSTAIFSEIKRNVLSKTFKNGRIASLFASIKIDFSAADINGTVIIDITQAFSETKIIVPDDWFVAPDHTPILGEIKDKRINKPFTAENNKILVIRGFSIFANVVIKSVATGF